MFFRRLLQSIPHLWNRPFLHEFFRFSPIALKVFPFRRPLSFYILHRRSQAQTSPALPDSIFPGVNNFPHCCMPPKIALKLKLLNKSFFSFYPFLSSSSGGSHMTIAN